jgi:hypothetical protein
MYLFDALQNALNDVLWFVGLSGLRLEGLADHGMNHEFGSVRSDLIDGLPDWVLAWLGGLLVLIWDEPESLILAQSERWRHA